MQHSCSTNKAGCCRAAEKLAVALGTPADLPSRLASAFIQALTEAASSNGHSYMSWEDLQQQSLTLLHNSGKLDALVLSSVSAFSGVSIPMWDGGLNISNLQTFPVWLLCPRLGASASAEV